MRFPHVVRAALASIPALHFDWRGTRGLIGAVLAAGAICGNAQTVAPTFASSYSLVDLGTIAGLPTPFGGLTFKAGDPNTILIGGSANASGARVYAVPVSRGAGNHISGFGSPVAQGYGANIDAGIAYGPGGILFYTRYPNNQLVQVRPGSNADDVVINLHQVAVLQSPGALVFVPPGFNAAGRMKVSSYSDGALYDVPISAAGGGYTVSSATKVVTQLAGGPEGLVYAPLGSPLFTPQTLLVTEYSAGKVAAYDTDANNNPILASRRDFITGLAGGEGAVIDPVTGDFLFSTFGGGNKIIQVRGFTPPPPPAVVAVSSSANPSSYGADITLAATVTGAAPVTGAITFQDAGADIVGCVGVVLVSGTATCSTAALVVGNHPITAYYAGNSTNASASGALAQSVLAALPTAITGAAVVRANGVTLNGTAGAGGVSTTVAFEYGTTASYGSSVTANPSPIATTDTNRAVSVTLTAVACGTLYHYRTSATNSAATANGSDRTFTTAPCPALTAINPDQGPLAGGASVTLTGTGFGAGMYVNVDGVSGACYGGVIVSSPTSASCTMRAHAVGPVSITIGMPAGVSNAVTYTYDSVPSIAAFNPTKGPSAGGWPVTITGTGFVAGMTVNVAGGATPCQPVTVQSQTTATCIMPAHALGPANVTVTTPGGTSTQTKTVFYVDAPEVTSVAPARGPLAGGTVVTLTGSSFFAVSSITVGGAACVGKTVVSLTEMRCTTPPGVSGNANVVVTNAGGSSSPVTFTYDNVPSVTGVKPTQGPLSGGTQVTISGTSFVNGSTTVTVGGATCAPVVFLSDAKVSCATPARAAGAAAVVVTTTGGPSVTNGTFTYDDLPVIATVSPAEGVLAGGTTITLTGSSFVPGKTTFDVGGAACTGATVIDQTTATCVTPAGTTGVVDVFATTPGGTSALPGYYTYDDVPTIALVDPAEGPTAGATTIQLSGTSFVAGSTTVSVAGASCTGVNVSSPTLLTCVTPAGVAGVQDVVVTTPGGPSAPAFFTYDNMPVVKSVKPSQGPLAGGTTITITGSSFVSGGTTVLVGGAACTGVAVSGDKVLTCITPAGTGVADVTVTTAGGTSAPGYFTYDDLPTLVAINPGEGPAAGGTTITLDGTGFVAGATVSVGGAACASVVISGTTSITCATPARPAGSTVVSVSTPGGLSNTLSFVFDPVPTLSLVSPAEGPAAGGTTIALTGTGFVVGATTVSVGGAPCTAVNVSSASQLTCITPAGAAGAVNVIATTPGGPSNAITYTFDSAPSVTTVSPLRGPVAGGTTITLTGTGYMVGSTAVSVAGQACAAVNVASATSLTCVTPAAAAGAANVIVTTLGGPGPAATFTYDAIPTANFISPSGGPLAGGTTLTIGGTGFVIGSTTVFVAGVACVSVNVASATSLTCDTPAGVAGTASVVVTTPGGPSNAVPFVYNVVPGLAAVDPFAGPLAGGLTITLRGTDFVASATTVTVGGVACTGVTVLAPTVVTCTTPAGPAGTAPVLVTTPGGTSPAVPFIYSSGPTLTSMSPSIGPPSGGTTITLTGTGFFLGGTNVSVGGATCAGVSVASGTSLTCVTPAGSGSASVVATTSAGSSNALTFSYAACGAANGVASAFPPSTNLCIGATASAVTSGSPWTWTCTVPSVGAFACSAPNQATATGSGQARAVISGGTWIVDFANTAGFIPTTGHPKSPPSLPPGYSFPHGLLEFRLINGAAGSPATVTITYPAALPPGTVYWKYGPSPSGFNCAGAACATPHWYQMPAIISGNTVTLTIVDGGVGDDDLVANSVIVDQGGPGVLIGSGVAPIPALSRWATILLSLMLAGTAAWGLRREN
jgi:hypothetical protein